MSTLIYIHYYLHTCKYLTTWPAAWHELLLALFLCPLEVGGNRWTNNRMLDRSLSQPRGKQEKYIRCIVNNWDIFKNTWTCTMNKANHTNLSRAAQTRDQVLIWGQYFEVCQDPRLERLPLFLWTILIGCVGGGSREMSCSVQLNSLYPPGQVARSTVAS